MQRDESEGENEYLLGEPSEAIQRFARLLLSTSQNPEDPLSQNNFENYIDDLQTERELISSSAYSIQHIALSKERADIVLRQLQEMFGISSESKLSKCQNAAKWTWALVSPAAVTPLIYFGLIGLPKVAKSHSLPIEIVGGVLGGFSFALLGIFIFSANKDLLEGYFRALNVSSLKQNGHRNFYPLRMLWRDFKIGLVCLASTAGSVTWNYAAFKDYGASKHAALGWSFSVGFFIAWVTNTVYVRDANDQLFEYDWVRYLWNSAFSLICRCGSQCCASCSPSRKNDEEVIYRAVKHVWYNLLYEIDDKTLANILTGLEIDSVKPDINAFFKLYHRLLNHNYNNNRYRTTCLIEFLALPTAVIANFLYTKAGKIAAHAIMHTLFKSIEDDGETAKVIDALNNDYIVYGLWLVNSYILWLAASKVLRVFTRVGHNPLKKLLIGMLIVGGAVGALNYVQNVVVLGTSIFDQTASVLSSLSNTLLAAAGLSTLISNLPECRSSKNQEEYIEGFTKPKLYQFRQKLIGWCDTFWKRVPYMETDSTHFISTTLKAVENEQDTNQGHSANFDYELTDYDEDEEDRYDNGWGHGCF